MVGRSLGKYRVLEKIGTGALADVYRGIQIGLDREVAIKVLPAALAADREMVLRFKRESTATARLSHPNIITIFDSGEQDGVHFYVMEYLAREALADRLEVERPLSLERALKIGQDVIKALIFAHEKGVAHRALSSQSVYFDTRGNAVLTDFAPGESELADPHEDLEAVAEILREMLDPELPGDVAALIDRALSKDRSARPPTARDMLVELKRIELKDKAHRIVRATHKARVAALAPRSPLIDSDPWGFLSSLSCLISAQERRAVAPRLWWAVPLVLLTGVATVWLWRLIAGT